MKNGIDKDLSPLCRSFVIQGLRYLVGGTFLLAIPFLTYARAATVQFSFAGGALDAQILILLVYMLVCLHGILFASLGPLILAGGLAYVRRAQTLLNSSLPGKVLLDLNMRQSKLSLNGGTLLDGIVTYDDGSQESFKLVSHQKPQNLLNLIAQSTQVDMYGEPKSNPRPRVFDTPYGVLLEQPNELGLVQSIFGFSDKSKFLERRVRGKIASLATITIAYLLFLSPISLNLSMFPEHSKPILSVTVVASLLFLLADLFESMKLVRMKESLQKVDCQFTLLKRGILAFVNPKISKVNVVFQDGRDSLRTSLLLESFNKVPCGEPIYGSAYIDAAGRVVGIVNGATSLIKSKAAYWTIAPLVLYLVMLPLFVSSMQPDMTKKIKFDNGDDYYQQGVLYKAYGWTEKAREAMIEAQGFDKKTRDKAKLYIRTHLPVYPISKDAERMNIKGYNLMALRKTDQAIEAFKNCIAKYPEFEWPYGNLGSLYIKLGNFEQAKFFLDKAIAINPDYINALRHLAEMELRQGHKEKALMYLDKISALDKGESYVEIQKFAIKASI